MDGRSKSRRERWMERAEAVYQRMFEGKGAKELVTLTQRESMAVLIAKELAGFMLEEHVATDPAAQPVEASTACCRNAASRERRRFRRRKSCPSGR